MSNDDGGGGLAPASSPLAKQAAQPPSTPLRDRTAKAEAVEAVPEPGMRCVARLCTRQWPASRLHERSDIRGFLHSDIVRVFLYKERFPFHSEKVFSFCRRKGFCREKGFLSTEQGAFRAPMRSHAPRTPITHSLVCLPVPSCNGKSAGAGRSAPNPSHSASPRAGQSSKGGVEDGFLVSPPVRL